MVLDNGKRTGCSDPLALQDNASMDVLRVEATTKRCENTGSHAGPFDGRASSILAITWKERAIQVVSELIPGTVCPRKRAQIHAGKRPMLG